MTDTPPTLAEMRHALADLPSSVEGGTPTLAEMMHANALYQADPDAYLEHYGIKGMKWGVRRSREVLGRLTGRAKDAAIGTKDEEGNVVGGIRAKSRAGAQKLKDMKEGSTLVLEDANGASKVMSKQKDGTFKEVYLSADAERVLRTTKKDQSEMSDKEINDAINRAKKIEDYNKIFAPNPNADLAAKVNAMELQLKMKQLDAALNPKKVSRVKRFITGAESTYDTYKRIDKKSGGKLTEMMSDIVSDMSKGRTTNAGMAAKVAAAAAQARADNKAKKDAEDRFWSGGDKLREPTPAEQKRVDDFVYNITSMGNQDPLNPYYSPPGATSLYPELEPRRD